MFDWLIEIFTPTETPSIGQSMAALGLAVVVGSIVGRIKIKKISIGIAGVLFAGLALGHLGFRLQAEVLLFVRDLGLLLFVYAIGMQVGPTFFASLRSEGLRFNLLAVGTILTGVFIAWLIMYFTHTPADQMVGIMSGAVTNTPGLGAAKSALGDLARQNPGQVYTDPANGYAITYPIGAIGAIAVMLLLKGVHRIDPQVSLERFEADSRMRNPRPERVKCRVVNPGVFGRTVADILHLIGGEGVVITRLKRSGTETVVSPRPETVLQERDVLMVVGLPEDVERAVAIIGRESTDMMIESEKEMITRDFYVTKTSAARKTLAQIDLENTYGARISRVYRAGLEFVGAPQFLLHYGDRVRVVGDAAHMEEVGKLLGDSVKDLQQTDLMAVFIGILLGIILGALPVALPGLPVSVRLGMAAGPLLVAIFLSHFGGIGRIKIFLNPSAQFFMRDFGICLFFAAVGIGAGKNFYEIFMKYGGWWWVLYGVAITFIPLLAAAWFGYFVMKINYLQLIGILGGSYTSPPSLAFSTGFFGTDVPAQAYAAVFPLATLVRILVAQLFVLYFIS